MSVDASLEAHAQLAVIRTAMATSTATITMTLWPTDRLKTVQGVVSRMERVSHSRQWSAIVSSSESAASQFF
ncbi:hypothetical protein [Variovorax sp. SRS16]|uniref:hypothetical protein n=1 Tax=Variovorax sp. SRS16 TaxID=282217 RepID=UPI0013A52F9B|nr:hypothetical protein [Variovorax sp. SRS16]